MGLWQTEIRHYGGLVHVQVGVYLYDYVNM